MPDPEPKNKSGLAKLLTLFAVGMLLGFGICALAAAAVGGRNPSAGPIALGSFVFFASFLGFVITLFWWVVKKLFGKD
jgi:hypothetical protein